MAKKDYEDSMFQILQNNLNDLNNKVNVYYRDVVLDDETTQNVCFVELLDPKGDWLFRVSHPRNSDVYSIEVPDYKVKFSDKQKEYLYNFAQNRDKLLLAEKQRKSKKYRYNPGKSK